MRFRKLLLLLGIVLLGTAILAVFLTPVLVSTGLRFWIARTAQQERLIITFEKLDAQLLRPVVIQKLRVTNQPDAPFRTDISAGRVEIDLHFRALFGSSHGRFLHSLTAEGVGVDIRRNEQNPNGQGRVACRMIERLLADNFKLSGVQLHIENGETVVDVRDGTLSAALIEAGVLSADEMTIASPWFRKTFSELRGVTSWQDSQLTIGALAVTRGLDLDSLAVDLSHIGESRIGLEVSLDAFGGKLRARISNDNRDEKQTWDAAGTASEISLAQMSDALDLTDRASGSLHACKFTFRGEANNLREATASIWAEVTELTWRDRTANTIMIGATLYNHQVQMEQLFVKQRNNQFTLSGESPLPQKWSDWLNPDFHGDISASINDLGDFARLFGAKATDFAGKIDISGNVTARERKLGGQLLASGNSLVLFRAPVESLKVQLSINDSQIDVSEFELLRKDDSFHGKANVDLTGQRKFSFSITSSIADIADYADLIAPRFPIPLFRGSLNLDWSGQGTESSHSGTFHATGHGFHSETLPIAPFDAELQCEYSPDKIFFQQFKLTNQHAAIDAFVTVANDFVQLQALRFDLNGKPKLQGNLFLPISLSKLYPQGNWLTALAENPVFDLNLALDSVDLGELASAVTKLPKLFGQASANLEIYGAPASLEGRTILHLRDFVSGVEPRISVDMDARIAGGALHARTGMITRGSNPVVFEGTIPLRLEKRESDFVLNTSGPLFATLNFPAILLSSLPVYLSQWTFVDGILSGNLMFSDSLQHPQVRGSANLINARLLGNMSVSAGINFESQIGTIDFVQLGVKTLRTSRSRPPSSTAYTADGKIDFRDLNNIKITISPNLPVTTLTLLDANDCITGIQFLPNSSGGLPRGQQIDEIDIQGPFLAPNWTITLSEKHSDDPLETLLRGGGTLIAPFCHDIQQQGKTLTLGLSQAPLPFR